MEYVNIMEQKVINKLKLSEFNPQTAMGYGKADKKDNGTRKNVLVDIYDVTCT